MMMAVRDWALTVCIAAVAGSLVRMAAPEGATQKVLNLTVSLFFLCALVSPVLTGAVSGELTVPDFEQSEAQYNTQALEEQMQRQVEESFRGSMEQAVDAALREAEAVPLEIFVNINTEGQGGISITEVRVTLAAHEQSRSAELSQLLLEKTGQKPVFAFAEENGTAKTGG